MGLMDGALELPFNANFEKIDRGPDLPELDEALLKSMSHDQHVGFRYYKLVKTGYSQI